MKIYTGCVAGAPSLCRPEFVGPLTWLCGSESPWLSKNDGFCRSTSLLWRNAPLSRSIITQIPWKSTATKLSGSKAFQFCNVSSCENWCSSRAAQVLQATRPVHTRNLTPVLMPAEDHARAKKAGAHVVHLTVWELLEVQVLCVDIQRVKVLTFVGCKLTVILCQKWRGLAYFFSKSQWLVRYT